MRASTAKRANATDQLQRLCELLARQRFGEQCAVRTAQVFGEGVCWLETIDGSKVWHVRASTEEAALQEMQRSLLARPIPLPEAARRLGVSLRRAQDWAQFGWLPCFKLGRDWHTDERSLERFAAKERKPGRPPRRPLVLVGAE